MFGFPRGAHTGVDFGYVDRTTGQEVALVQDFVEQMVPIPHAVDSVNYDTGIEQECGHVSGPLFFESASRLASAAWPPTWCS
jgi:hypothetical protein